MKTGWKAFTAVSVLLLATYSSAWAQGHVSMQFGTNTALEAAFRGDGSLFYFSDYFGIMTFDASTRRLVDYVLIPHAGDGVAVSPTGGHVAAGGRIYDLATGAKVSALPWSSDPSLNLFSPDGTVIVGRDDAGALQAWRWQTQASAATNSTLTSPRPAAFSPNGEKVGILAGGAYLWDLQANVLTQIDTNFRRPTAIAFSPDSSKVAVGYDGSYAVMYDVATRTPVRGFGIEPHLPVDQLALPANDTLQVRIESDLYVWNATTGKLLRTVTASSPGGKPVAFSPTGSMVVGGGVASATEWNYSERVASPAGSSNQLSLSTDGMRLVDSKNTVWDTATGAAIFPLLPAGKATNDGTPSDHGFAISPNGEIIGTVAGVTILATGNTYSIEAARMQPGGGNPHPYPPFYSNPYGEAVGFSADSGTLLVLDKGGDLRRIPVQTRDETSTFVVGAAYGCLFSADGSRLFVNRGVDWSVVNAATSAIVRTVPVPDGSARVLEATFSHDGARFVSLSEDGLVRVEATDSGAELAAFHVPAVDPAWIAISRDNSMIYTDGTIRDAQTGSVLNRFDDPSIGLADAVFSPDGSKLYISAGQALVAWEIGPLPTLLATQIPATPSELDVNADGVIDSADVRVD